MEAARPYHHGNLRTELLAQAERVLADRGAAALSLRELAREIGVSHGAPRRHFRDKQTLLNALAEDGFERLRGELADALEDVDAPFRDRLVAMARAYVRFATRSPALLDLMFATKHRADAAASLDEAATRAFAAPLALILDGQHEGQIAKGEPERIAMVAFATFHGIAAMANSGLLDATTL
jgi:AcrR family transcriptional regulator